MGRLALKRAIRHAEANDLISRNVAALADTPQGQPGRPSKSLTLDQAIAVITVSDRLLLWLGRYGGLVHTSPIWFGRAVGRAGGWRGRSLSSELG
jgi:hypothetical protein